MTRKIYNTARGMTMMEAIIAIAILSIVMLGTTTLFATIWKMQGFSMREGLASQQASYAVTRMTDLIRDARQADNGMYAVVSATPNEFIVYTDMESDGVTERVRFYRDGGGIYRGITVPGGGFPVTYNTATETVEQIARDVVDNDDSVALFTYFDADNAQIAASPTIETVRMVQITVTVDVDPTQLPEGVQVASFASLRNLREW